MNFYDEFVSPLLTGLDMHKAYVLSSSKWYKVPVWSLPSAEIEFAVGGFRQYYRDSQWEGYSSYQRGVRVLIASGEAYTIDKTASGAGSLGGLAGGAALGPFGAFLGYGVVSYATSSAGYDVSKSFNNWLFPAIGLGNNN